MVGHGIVFGILLTDKFGRSYADDLVNEIKVFYTKNNYTYPEGIADFPSAEDDQLAIGFFVKLGRDMDIAQLDATWEDLTKKLPPEILEIYNKHEWKKPDFHVMSGSY